MDSTSLPPTLYHVETDPANVRIGEPFKIILRTRYEAVGYDRMQVTRDDHTVDEQGRRIELPLNGPRIIQGQGMTYVFRMVFLKAAKAQEAWPISFQLNVNGQTSILTVRVELSRGQARTRLTRAGGFQGKKPMRFEYEADDGPSDDQGFRVKKPQRVEYNSEGDVDMS